MSRTPHKAEPLTIASLIEGDRGINLLCKCGHKTSLLPLQFATMAHPATRLLDFKRRFRCSMCGRSGASDEIKIATFEVAPALATPKRAPQHRTPH